MVCYMKSESNCKSNKSKTHKLHYNIYQSRLRQNNDRNRQDRKGKIFSTFYKMLKKLFDIVIIDQATTKK